MTFGPQAKPNSSSAAPLVDAQAPGPNGFAPNVDDLLAARSSQRARDQGDGGLGQQRLTTFRRPLDVGEQVLGSRQVFSLQPPELLEGTRPPTIVTVTVPDGTPFTASWAPYTFLVPPSAADAKAAFQQAIAVLFAPKQTGAFGTTVTFSAMWSDGHVEHVKTELTGRARKIDDAPAGADEVASGGATGGATGSAARSTADAQREGAELMAKDAQDPTPYPQNAVNAFEDASTASEKAAERLAHTQGDAVESVAMEASHYTAPIMPGPLWKDLLEIAITMGTAGVASIVSKALVGHIAKVIESAGKSTTASAAIRAMAKVVENEDSLIVEGATAAVEDGLKKAAEMALDHPEPSEATTDGIVDFFNHQKAALRALEAVNGDNVLDAKKRLRPLLRTNPAMGAAAMTAIGDSFKAAKDGAHNKQTTATSVAWVAYQGRVHQGVAKVAGTETEVTDLRDAGKVNDKGGHGDLAANAPAGLLDVVVTDFGYGSGKGPYQITEARVNGVAAAVAHRLADVDLGSAKIPLRIVVNGGRVITRDESGRVRVDGKSGREGAISALPHEHVPADANAEQFVEVDAERGAQEIIAFVLARPLAQRGVTVTSDDTSPQSETERAGESKEPA